MSGTGTTNANGGLTLGAAGTTDQETLDGRTLNNFGAATLAAVNVSYGLLLSSGATFDNKPGASFTFTTDASILSNGGSPAGGTFINEGTLSKTGGSASSVIGVRFHEHGQRRGPGAFGQPEPQQRAWSSMARGSSTRPPRRRSRSGGGLTGTTQNVDGFTPLGSLVLGGTGSASSPQTLEVMGQDLGNVTAGFTHNFVYGSLALSGGTYVRLVDNAHNSTGSGPEALYVDTLTRARGDDPRPQRAARLRPPGAGHGYGASVARSMRRPSRRRSSTSRRSLPAPSPWAVRFGLTVTAVDGAGQRGAARSAAWSPWPWRTTRAEPCWAAR